MSRTRRLALNALANYLRFLVSSLSMLALTPIIVQRLGEATFGLWSLTFSILGIFALLDCGFGTTVVKYVAECRGRGEIEQRNRLISTLFVVYCGLALVAVSSIALLAIGYNRWFEVPIGQHREAVWLLGLLSLRMVVLALPMGLFRDVLFGEQHVYRINVVQIVCTLLYSAAIYSALQAGGGIMAMAWINLGMMLLEYAAYIGLAYRYIPDLHLDWRLANRTTLREVLSFSSAQFVVNMAGLVRLRTDPILVKLFLSLSEVGSYTIALRIAENMLLLTKQFTNVLAPFVAEMHGAGEVAAIRTLLVRGAKFAFAASLMLALPIAFFARELLLAWVGSSFVNVTSALIVLVSAMCLVILQMMACSVLAMSGYHRQTARADLIGIVVNLGMSVLLARPLGMLGIALGTLISTITVDLFVVVGMACRAYGIGYGEYARQVIVPVLIPAGAFLGITSFIRALAPPSDLRMIAVECLPGLLLYGLLFAAFGLQADEAAMILRRRRSQRSLRSHVADTTV